MSFAYEQQTILFTMVRKFSRLLPRCVFVSALLLIDHSLGFVPRIRRTVVGNNGEVKPSSLFASTLPGPKLSRQVEEEAEVKSTTENSTSQSGVDALRRLLARQQAELDETKRLLELYESAAGFESRTSANAFTGDNQAELLSIASSMLKGFDYGFSSRSEGPTFKNLKGGNAAFIGYGPPANVLAIGTQQFMRNLNAMRNEYEEEKDIGESCRDVSSLSSST